LTEEKLCKMSNRKTVRQLGLIIIQLLCVMIDVFGQTQVWNPNHSVGTVNGVYNFSYNQTPSQLVEVYAAAVPNTGLTYQWESSFSAATGFTPIVSNGTSSSYTIPGALSVTT